MSKFKIIPIVLVAFLSFIHVTIAQEDAIHKKINADMYGKFSKAFKTLDYDLFASIHSKEMIRISGNGGEIKKAGTYLKGYQKRWSAPSQKPAPIDFRLFERVYSDSLVSDRGIYRVTYIDDNNQTKYSYGQFHVVLKMEDQSWKILIDYDSDENKTITKDNYDAAFSISEYKKYWKH
ncbi:hypothetical protein ATO12_24525 [Aquimarina atlantica]|uniref:Uncharacterized protein n=1 Tax=Aquimarina atlantica TaxID=1317122 RepID=A0A023BQ51_9FLAO|nr:nuclear transport factor 2 family protein [Aquimarina atlantica]EZH72106.1 hypothetical protein ATO12_24525 [Aquimarina atlantica]